MNAVPRSIQGLAAPTAAPAVRVPPALALRPGDTLETVAARHDLAPAQLEAVLVLPFEQRPRLVVAPEAGETLTLLAREVGHGASARELARENGFDLTKLGGKPWFDRAEATSAAARRSTRGRDPDLVFRTDRLLLPERVARAWWATLGAESAVVDGRPGSRPEASRVAAAQPRRNPTSLAEGIAPGLAAQRLAETGAPGPSAAAGVQTPAAPLAEARSPSAPPLAGRPPVAADAGLEERGGDGGAGSAPRRFFDHPMLQGAMAIAATLPGIGQVVSAIGAVLSLLSFAGNWSRREPHWPTLVRGVLYGLGIFFPGAGAFGGLAGMLFGAGAAGEPTTVAPAPAEPSRPELLELETGTDGLAATTGED